MTPYELLRDEAAKWRRQAAKDRNAARIPLHSEPSRSAFHSQQAAEKTMKAFLTFHQIPFRKTHGLADLGSQCATVDPSLEPILRELVNLTSALSYPS
jgi:HEPN domain-containing protein